MLEILFVISILNVFMIIIDSIVRDSQNLTLMTRILIDLFFLIMIFIKTIIKINNNNSSNHKLFKNNNVRYSKLVDLYKLLTKT